MNVRQAIQKFFSKEHCLILGTGLAVSIALVCLYIIEPHFLTTLDYKVYDQLLIANHSNKTSGKVAIIDLDEQSLAEYGQWPWPRTRVALLLGRAQQAGARSIGLDILFSEPDRTSPRRIQDQLLEELNVAVQFKGLPPALMDNDLILADMFKHGPYVPSFYFQFRDLAETGVESPADCGIHPFKTAVKTTTPGISLDITRFLRTAKDTICPLPEFCRAAPLMGFMNTNQDSDGIIRSVPMLMAYGDQAYPSLALATFLKGVGRDSTIVKVSDTGIDGLRIGKGFEIPVDNNANMRINYRGGMGAFPYISASDVLKGKAGDRLKGKFVLLGTTAAGLLDLRATPFGSGYPGVECHATVIDNILMQDFLLRPDSMDAVEAFATLFCGIIAAALLTWTSASISVVPVLILAVGLWFGAAWSFEEQHIYVSPLYPYLALFLNFTLLTFLKFWREESQKKFIHATFSSYLSPELIEQMVDSKTMPELGGEAREVTALFTDIQSFSTFSEKLTAPQLVELLNEYLSAMTDILIEEKGTLDKYEGDAIIAFVGAPLDVPDHAYRACRILIRMQEACEQLCRKWAEERQSPDEPERNGKQLPPEQWTPGDKWPRIVHEMKTRIGLNSGEIVVGNMGSAMRMNYTMMGDAVNLAARLESGAKQYGILSMVSEYVLDCSFTDDEGNTTTVSDLVEYRFLDRIQVVGKEEPVAVYELFALKGELNESDAKLISTFNTAMQHYLKMEWDKAIAAFTESEKYERYPEMRTTPSRVFIARCEEYRLNPPVADGESWDGVHRLTSK